MAQIGTRQLEGVGRVPGTRSRLRGRPFRKLDDSRFFPLILLLPILIFFLIWNVIPLLWLVGLSFYKYDLTSPEPARWLGLDNFTAIYNDAQVWGALGRTLSFMFFSVGLQTVLGVVLGLLFWGSSRMPGRRIALTLLFTPMLLPPIAIGSYWRLIYDPIFGVLNYYAREIFGRRYDFLGSKDYAFPAAVAVDVWMWTPFMILMTLAALASVPKAELEAAEVDRLPWLKRLWYVVLPHGKFILMLGILLRTIDAFKTTDMIFVMTKGGPGVKTELIGLTVWRRGFASFSMGAASALAVIALLIAIAFTSIYLYVLNYRETRAQFR